MVTSSVASTAAGSAGAQKGKGGNKGAKAGGKGGQGAGKAGGGKGGGKKALSLIAVTRRVAAIEALTDAAKAKRGRQRLVHNLLAGIADGSVKQPAKAAQAVMTLMPKKPASTADE